MKKKKQKTEDWKMFFELREKCLKIEEYIN